MSRRLPLVVGLALGLVMALVSAVLSLTGLTTTSQLSGTPAPTYTPPPPPPIAGADQAAELALAAWAPLAGLAAGEDPKWAELAQSVLVFWQVLTGPDPLQRQFDPAAQPEVVPGGSTDSAADALSSLAALAWEQAAAAPDGPTAAWWTGLAGSSEQVLSGITGTYLPPATIDPLITVARLPEIRAVSELLSAYHEAVYATTALAGRLAPGSGYMGHLQGLIQQLRYQRDALTELAAAKHWPATAPAPAYQLPPVNSDAEVLQALAEIQRDLAEAATSWLASTTTHRAEVIALLKTLPTAGLGYTSAAWFGWPDPK